MTIVIGCDSFLSFRNVGNGNLGHYLAGERVVVLVDPNQYDGTVQVTPKGVEVGKLLEFDPRKDSRLAPLMNRAYMARKCYYDPPTIWGKLKASSAQNHRDVIWRELSLLAARMRMATYWAAGRLGRAQAWRQEYIQALRSHPIMSEYQTLLSSLDAQLVVLFSLEGLREMALAEAANLCGIPVAVMIRSRDNLAAKIQHLPDACAYLVWADVTRNFLLHLYPEIPPENVYVTGSPQFDHHLAPDYRLSREAFFQRIGLDPNRPLVVYSCATPELIGHEIHIVQHLADAVGDGKLSKNAQLLVRGHPRGFGSSYPLLEKTYPGVAVYPSPSEYRYRSPEHEAQVVRLILEDEPMHLAVLANQDVQVNVSGTMIVDSAILDKPIVAVHYDIPETVLAGISVKRFYKRTDMQSIINSGGLRLANSPEECISLINRYLEDPSLDSEGRQRIMEHETGRLDGRAGERIATIMQQLVRKQ